MLIAALCALAVGAVAGIFLAVRHFLRRHLPVWVALLHGLGGATGFTFVLLVVVQQPDFRLARQALYLFIVTIVLGVVNLLFHVRKKRHRTSLIVMHALVAVSGVLTLVYAIFVGDSEPESAVVRATGTAPPEPVASAPVEAAPPAPVESRAPSAPAPDAPAGAPATKASADLGLDAAVRDALATPIVFGTKSSEVAPESLPALAAIAKVLKEHPEIELVEVQGHADERGDDARNIELTRGRAAVVLEALVARGVARGRLASAGYGSRCPADPECRGASAPEGCHAPERWSADRRVVLVPLEVGNTSFAGELVCARGAELIPVAHRPYHRP